MKNKGFIKVLFVVALLVGGVFSVSNAPAALAYHDDYGYGYDDYGYDDYGYGYDYGYDDYSGYDDCYYDCGGYDYDYGYDYGYEDCGYYGCDDYWYDDCSYDCYDYPVYDDCSYDCYDYPEYDDCYRCDEEYDEPSEERDENVNYNNNVNENINNITIRNYVGGHSEPVRERVRENDPLVCTPSSQTAPVNQSVSLRVSGGTGTYSWNAPGSQSINGRGDSVSLRYPTSGLKTITVSSGGDTATCFVQVTGGQVLAEFIEFPNTGAGGSAKLPSVIALGGAILAIAIASLVFVRRFVLA